MSTTPTTTRAAIAVAIAGLTASLLTGCFGNPGDLVNQGVEEAIESATGGDVSLGELPEDFPESVPVIEGDVAGGASGSNDAPGWTIVVTSTSADPMADATAALEAAGFADDGNISGDGGGAAGFSNGEYSVLLIGQGKSVSYTVTPQQ